MAGYSGTPLAQKLGIKSDVTVVVISGPSNYRKLLGPIADSLAFTDRATAGSQFIHFFASKRRELEKKLPQFRRKLADAGTLWVSWPKKSSGVETDVTEDVVRAVALPLGLVDIKVCAVNETWSALKLLIRREQRKGARA